MSEILDKIVENFYDYDFLTADGFDEAVIGYEEHSMKIIYSVSKCIDILIEDGMSEIDALEYFTYNVSGAHVGDKTPIWCWDYFP